MEGGRLFVLHRSDASKRWTAIDAHQHLAKGIYYIRLLHLLILFLGPWERVIVTYVSCIGYFNNIFNGGSHPRRPTLSSWPTCAQLVSMCCLWLNFRDVLTMHNSRPDRPHVRRRALLAFRSLSRHSPELLNTITSKVQMRLMDPEFMVACSALIVATDIVKVRKGRRQQRTSLRHNPCRLSPVHLTRYPLLLTRFLHQNGQITRRNQDSGYY